jgi:hypothetical protein
MKTRGKCQAANRSQCHGSDCSSWYEGGNDFLYGLSAGEETFAMHQHASQVARNPDQDRADE